MTPAAWYAERAAAESDAAEALDAAASRLVTARVGTAIAVVVLVILVEPLSGTAAWAAAAGALASLVAFVVVVLRQRSLRDRAAARRIRETLAREGLARLARDWAALDRTPEAAALPADPPPDHPYAADLGLVGHASLQRLCGPLTTAGGRHRLTHWLLEPAPAEEATRRRDAVQRLAPAAETRLELAARGRGGEPESLHDVARLLRWAETPTWLDREPALRWAAWLLPPVTVALLTLHVYGLLGLVAWPAASVPWWFLPLGAQGWLLRRAEERLDADFHDAVAVRPSVPRYADQLHAVADLPGGTPLLDAVRAAAGAAEDAPELLRGLARRLDWVESRANAYYPVFNYLLLTDVHIHRALERWKAGHGGRVRGWLDALGEAEALAALATLAHDHPDWSFPAMREPGAEPDRAPLEARALGHPLLRPDACVRNDVSVPPPGAFLLVTGSNMSGKSTLLRALGANVVLALAGGPVCAEALALEPVRLHTSMTVDDSLEAGVSRFMAELLRMKRVVDAARATGPDDPPVLYLLDEVLQGTNTGERRAGARTVLRHLLDEGAVGAVTTHDLTLHEAPDLERRAEAYHFRESVARDDEGPRLAFDYRLRGGLSTTQNAMVLLEAVGLGPGEGHPREEGDAAD